MGIYLNSRSAYTLYKSETEKPYFVDKTKMLEELFPLVRTGNNHICITRPRRFGKTVMANMIASFFSKHVMHRIFFSRSRLHSQRSMINIGISFRSFIFRLMNLAGGVTHMSNTSSGLKRGWLRI